jgi:hypothetical protein
MQLQQYTDALWQESNLRFQCIYKAIHSCHSGSIYKAPLQISYTVTLDAQNTADILLNNIL